MKKLYRKIREQLIEFLAKMWIFLGSLKSILYNPGFLPYLWTIIFLVLTLIVIIKLSFSTSIIDIPPYTELISIKDKTIIATITFSNYLYLFSEYIHLQALYNSLVIAIGSTILALLIAYPIAFVISNCRSDVLKEVMMILLIVPFWTSFLIRVYACITLISPNGIINNLLLKYGLIKEPIFMIYNSFAVCCGIVYVYLPFVVLPIYSAISKIDPLFLDAAHMMKCGPMKTFFKIVLPMSKHGIVSGAMSIFVAALGEYAIPELLGGTNTITIGKLIYDKFYINSDWPTACAAALVVTIVIMIPFIFWRGKKIELE